MAITTFQANVNKTVTVKGNIYSITVPVLPVGVRMFVNEVEVTAGETVELMENAVITYQVAQQDHKITVNFSNVNTVKYNNIDVTNGQVITVDGADNTIDFVGATAIPVVKINGIGINAFTVNSGYFTPDDLPYSFTPQGGIENQIFMDGSVQTPQTILLTGQNVQGITVNGEEKTLPYSVNVDQPLTIAISGKVYQVDIDSLGGAKISKNGVQITDGDNPYHEIIDIEQDTYFTMDGTHEVTLNGTNIVSVSMNGVIIPVDKLPTIIENIKMKASMIVNGHDASIVHLTGMYLDTVVLDGKNIPLADNGSLEYDFKTLEKKHYVELVGKQPREYALTWNNNGSTHIMMDGEEVQSGTSSMISKDVYISATPTPIPIHFESPSDVRVQIDGVLYTSNDFTFMVNKATEVDLSSDTCTITIDYPSNTVNYTIAQGIVQLVAPQVDNMTFNHWSSDDVGVYSSTSIKTLVDLTQRTRAHFVCHYDPCKRHLIPVEWK